MGTGTLSTTKATFHSTNALLEEFNRQVNECHFKRDALLEHVIRAELPNIEAELDGKVLSPDAKRYIESELRNMPLKPFNVVLQKETNNELRRVVKKHNLIRDSLINRILLLLIMPLEIAAALGIPTTVGEIGLPTPYTATFAALRQRLDDPFGYIRCHLEEQGEDSLYECLLHPKLIGFSCFISDDWVPGTAEKAKSDREYHQLIYSLLNSARTGNKRSV